MMGWGSFSSAVGSGWAWAPRPGQIWGYGGAYGGQRGSWLQRGGYLAPSGTFLPSPKASLLPLLHTSTYVGF